MKQKVGRPLQYKTEYCEMIINHMSKGKTIKSFAKKIGVTQRTISTWARTYPEFKYARYIGRYKLRK